MALVVNDRVRETSTTTGTGTLSLAGAVTGFETFSSAIGNTNTTYYAISNQANGEFEVGLGTVSAGALARTTVISSSNSDSAVDFSAGTKDVFCTLPASKSVILDSSGNIVANNGSNLTNLNATALATGTVANARLDAQLQDVAGLATTSGKIIQGDGSNFVLSAYTLPTADGSAGKVLTTDGSGAVTFETPTTGDITGVTAGTNLTGGGTSGDVTINLADASTSAKGAASFSSDNFTVSSGAVTIKDSGVFTAEIRDNAVTQDKIADDAVGADQLAANAVVTASIVDANVTLAKMAANSVGEHQYVDNSIKTVHISNDQITNAKIDNYAVDTAQINDNAVGLAQMASGTAGNIISYDASGNPVAIATGSSGQVLTSAGAGAQPSFQTPTVGDITGVTAGSGLTGGGTSGDVTLNVGAGTGVTVNANDIAIGQSVATSASPTFAGLTTTGNINFGDNDKAIFGAGSDLQIYHDGSNSIISDTGTGGIKILSGSAFYIRTPTDASMIESFNGSSVDLYYNNSKKFETTSTGVTATGEVAATSLDISGDIDVDGTTNLDVVDIDGAVDMASTLQVDGAITSSAGATITVSDNSDTLQLISSDADANAGPVLVLRRGSGSPADDDVLGRVIFKGNDDGINLTNYFTIDTRIADASNGSEDFKTVFSGMVAGTERHVFTLGSTEAVFNDGSQDIDFRVESNGQANAFKIDAGNDTASFAVPITTTENINFGDNDKAIFGAGSDLQIYHEGNHSFISDEGTGVLALTTNGASIQLNHDGENMILAFADAQVELFHDNSKKFETTSSGIDVTGEVLADKAYVAETTLTDGATISWNMSTQSVCKVTLGGNRTMAAPTNGSTGQFASITVIQDGTGSRTLTWNAVYEFASDTAPTLSTAANKADLFVFRYNGSKWLEVGRNLLLTVS